MALGKHVVLITQNRDEIAFDLKNDRNIQYSITDLPNLRATLVNYLQSSASPFRRFSCQTSIFHMPSPRHVHLGTMLFPGRGLQNWRYINSAAIDLFGLNESHEWINKPLSEFIDVVADKIDNMKVAEKTLQVLNEAVRAAHHRAVQH